MHARSTKLALWRFGSSAIGALKTRQWCVVVDLDFETAYNIVDPVALLRKLKAKCVPRYPIALSRAFLFDHHAHSFSHVSSMEYAPGLE